MNEPPLETVRETPRTAGYPDHLPDSPLGAWFHEMHDVPFDEWTDYQVRRSVRQERYIEQLIPRALTILNSEPLAGGYWTGDLLQLFTQIPSLCWEEHPDQKALAVEAAQAALNDPFWIYVSEDDDQEIKEIVLMIASGTIPKAIED